jgi:hypothetical protein
MVAGLDISGANVMNIIFGDFDPFYIGATMAI